MKNFSLTRDGQALSAGVATNPQPLAGAAELVASAGDVLVYNPGPLIIYLKAGAAGVAATLLSMPVPANTLQAFSKGSATHLDAVTAAGTQGFTVFVGEGQ